MKLIVQPYNGGAGAYNAEEEETKFRTYTLDHEFNVPAKAVITLADPDGSMMRKYNVSNGAVGGAVADDGGAETDETTEANEDTADDMTLLPAAPANNDAYYFGFSRPFSAVQLNISTAATTAGGGWTIVWEYSQGADAWAALGGVTDGTTNYFNAGVNIIDWTVPTDWATDTVGAIAGLYWVRGRATIVIPGTTSPIGEQAWIEGTYIGPGKVTLEDPTNTDVFYGRIVRAVGNFDDRTLTLECKDWLDQLDEEQITYDMREKLGTTDMRQSKGRSDKDGAFIDVAQNDGGTFYFYDDGEYDDAGGMAFANDQHNGQYLVFTVGMSGKRTWIFHAYDSTPNNEDLYDDNVFTTWVRDGSVDTCSANNDFEIDYFFRVWLGHNTPSDFYVHDSISGARVDLRYQVGGGANNHSHIQIDDATDGWIEFKTLEEDDHFIDVVFALEDTEVADIIDANGLATIRFDVDRAGGDASIGVSYLHLEIDTTTTGYSTPILINDTINPNKIEAATDLTAQATRVWEGIPYCIARKIYEHIDSAEVGTLISDGDIIVPLTHAGSVEHTSGISTRQYKNRTRLQIVQDLAMQDKAMFYMALGTTTLTYIQTFGANTETMTDATPDNWQSQRDYSSLVNSVDVYGARLGDYEIFQQSQDADSISTYIATRSKVIKDAGLVSDADASAIGTVIAARDANISQMVGCTLSGFDTTYRLGTIVEITSSYLWDTAAKDYIVTRWTYDSVQHKTFLTMHPKVSIGLQEVKTLMTEGESIKKTVLMSELDKVVNDPITHEIS